MNRDPLQELDTGTLLLRVVQLLESIDAKLDIKTAPPELITEVHAFIGGLAKFTASELVDRADGQLAAAIAGRSAAELGRELATAEGCTINGQRLMRAGRGGDGVIWRFC